MTPASRKLGSKLLTDMTCWSQEQMQQLKTYSPTTHHCLNLRIMKWAPARSRIRTKQHWLKTHVCFSIARCIVIAQLIQTMHWQCKQMHKTSHQAPLNTHQFKHRPSKQTTNRIDKPNVIALEKKHVDNSNVINRKNKGIDKWKTHNTSTTYKSKFNKHVSTQNKKMASRKSPCKQHQTPRLPVNS